MRLVVADVATQLAELLSAHVIRRGITGSDSDAFLFASTDGRPLDFANRRRRVWLPAVDTAELQGLGFHDLRRTNATAMVRATVDVKDGRSASATPTPG